MNASPYENVATKGSRTMAHRAQLNFLGSPTIPAVDAALKAIYRNGIQIFPAGNSTTETEFRRQFEARADVLDISLRIYENALNTEIGLGHSGASGASFVFEPGGVAAGNVFTDWATLVAAVSPLAGSVRIVMSPAFQTPTIPAGTWVFNGLTEFAGMGSFGSPLVIEDGAQLSGVNRFSGFLSIEYQGNAPCMYLSNVDTVGGIIIVDEGVSIDVSGAGPFFEVLKDQLAAIGMKFLSSLVNGYGNPVIGLQPSNLGFTTVYVFGDTGIRLENHTIAGPAGTFAFLVKSSVTAVLSQFHAGFLGSLMFFDDANASFIGYTPSNASNWAGSPPATVQEALDRIAAAPAITPIP